MSFLKLYTRVLRLLGSEARLGWILAIANVALAAAQFAEPVLFGRIIDALVKTQAANAPPDMGALTPLLGAWLAFGHFTSLAERASDALSNVALVQGFARVEAEVMSLRSEVGRLLAAQMPVLSWWAVIAVLTRSATTLTMLSIFLVGIYLNAQNLATIGEIVTFMNFAGLLIIRLEQVVGFSNRVLMDAPRLREFFQVLDTEPAVRDRPDAIDPGRLHGLIEFNDVSFSYDGKRAAAADLTFTALPCETIALVGSTGAGKSTALALLHRAFDPQSGAIKIAGMA